MHGRILLGALLAFATTTGCGARTVVSHDVKARTIPLTIKAANGVHRFKVEVARTSEQQARGLMFRPFIAPNGGMLFPMEPARPASFWMKNTVASLDLIFIRPDGSIARIAANAVPYSLDPIDSGEPVSAVLEIAGGGAAKLGISRNDKVSWAH
jgi:uncharacterized membrane protein (UPF0127 family)